MRVAVATISVKLPSFFFNLKTYLLETFGAKNGEKMFPY
jgi:hypothetical protein